MMARRVFIWWLSNGHLQPQCLHVDCPLPKDGVIVRSDPLPVEQENWALKDLADKYPAPVIEGVD